MINDILSHWLSLSIVTLLFYNTGLALYNLYFHPLAKYPGPILARISPWVNFYYASTGKRPFWIWQCHQIYGETFRYHPNGVFINSPVAFRDIHNPKANIRKTEWYHGMDSNPKTSSTLTCTDKNVHSRKRRILNSVFSDKAIRSSETFILKHVDRWNELILGGDGKDWGSSRDFSEWADYLVLDILGDLAFGRSFDTKEAEENPLKDIPHAIAASLKFMNPILHSPFLGVWNWLRVNGLKRLLDRLRPQSVVHFRKIVADSVARRMEIEEKQDASDEENKRKDMLHYLLQAKDPETGAKAYSRAEILSEANLLVIAGSDTTSIILTGLFFSLSRNKRIYNKLVREVRSTFKSVDDIRNGIPLYSCQYLRACIDESLRFSPTGGSEMPREAGPGGVTVNGEFFQGGTRLSTGIWSLYRHEEIFQDPHVYRPERWIVDEKAGVTEEDVQRVQTSFFPFSHGSYNCAGKNLAILELLITAARTLYRMDMRALPGDTTGECRPELGWGQRDRNTYELTGDYLAVDRKGPVLQFRTRQD